MSFVVLYIGVFVHQVIWGTCKPLDPLSKEEGGALCTVDTARYTKERVGAADSIVHGNTDER